MSRARFLFLTLPLIFPVFGVAADVATPLARAEFLVAAGRLPEAREPLEAILRKNPADLDAALLLARVYDRTGRRDDVITLLEPFLSRHPDNPRVLGLYAGACLLRAGELGAGLRAIRLARRGRELMERAVALDPDDIAYREGLVDFYQQAPFLVGGSLAKAREHAAAIVRVDPVRGGAWLAAIHLAENDIPAAFAASDAALSARPDDYVALFTLGKTAAETGRRLEDGEAALRRCLDAIPRPSEPSHAGVWYRLGRIAEHRGDLAAARQAHAEALRMEPSFTRPREALRRLGSRS